jgi:hypothetical protein
MAQSTGEVANSRKKRPNQTGQMVSTRLQPEIMKLVDDWRRDQPDLPTRPEAIRRLVVKGIGNG